MHCCGPGEKEQILVAVEPGLGLPTLPTEIVMRDPGPGFYKASHRLGDKDLIPLETPPGGDTLHVEKPFLWGGQGCFCITKADRYSSTFSGG